MAWLLTVSFVWAFSFGLIKGRLAGVDASLVAFVRVAIACLVFLPLLRPHAITLRDGATLAAIGAVQFGVMYVCYIAAFAHLAAFEVAALTIFTPVLVCLFDDLAGRRLRAPPYAAAALAVVGAAVILVDRPLGAVAWTGILLVQASNACFAAGQVVYRRWRIANRGVDDVRIFALLFLGATVATVLPAAAELPRLVELTGDQWLTLGYLGLIASGLGFFLWNRGAARTGAAQLAVVNNAKIPLAIAVSLLVFGETANLARLLAGGALMIVAGVIAARATPALQERE